MYGSRQCRSCGGVSRKRSISNECEHHPQYIPISECDKSFNNIRTLFCTCLGRCPYEQYTSNVDWPAKKDVGSCQPKMRDTSNKGRKREQHQSSGPSSTPISEDAPSSQSLGDLPVSSFSAGNENEGVATHSKRIKLTTPEPRKHDHGIFEAVSHSRVRSVGKISNAYLLERDFAPVNNDEDALERKTLSRNGDAAKDRKPSGDFLARYKKKTINHLPDYGYYPSVSHGAVLEKPLTEHSFRPPVVPNAVAITSVRSKMLPGERQIGGQLGAFKPVNSLQRNESSLSSLPRPPQKKVYDLHGNLYNKASDESHAAKRQKVSTRTPSRRESSSSVIDLSGDRSYVATVGTSPSTNSTPKRTVQSIGSRSQHPAQTNIIRLGGVDEYMRTEAIVGFDSGKQRKVALRRGSFWGETASSRSHHTVLVSDPQPLLSNREVLATVNGAGKPILIEDNEAEEVLEMSQELEANQDKPRNATLTQKVSNDTLGQKDESPTTSSPAEESHPTSSPTEELQHSINTDKSSGSQHPTPSNGSLGSISEASGNAIYNSPGGSRSCSDAIDTLQFLEEDSVDLLEPDVGTVGRKAESRAQSNTNLMRSIAVPKSTSISEDGDIPGSALSMVRTSQHWTRLTPTSEFSFEIIHVHTGSTDKRVEEGCLPWKLQYNYDKKEFDIVTHGDSPSAEHPGLILKPDKIHRVRYHHNSGKVFIYRATEAHIGSSAQILFQMWRTADGHRFAQCLKKLNHIITLEPAKSSGDLDKIFATTLANASKKTPEDIALIEAREARLATARGKTRVAATGSEKASMVDWSQPANARRQHSSIIDECNLIETRRQKIAKSMLPDSLTETSISNRAPRLSLPKPNEPSDSRRISIVKSEHFYGSRPATRASTGQWNIERQLQSSKSRSPSPVRWTAENPGWKEKMFWKASLLFPQEGKKRATVDARDIERLDEGEFLNDNLIEFYLRYLEDCLEKSQPERARRIYFQNTFFYDNLTKGKVRSNNINYDAVKRWTSKVDLFSYDYIIVPVCEKLHWYVAIICNAPRLLQQNVPEVQRSQGNVERVIAPLKSTPFTLDYEDDDSESSKLLGKSNESAKRRSASPPSVTTQVEHMSLDDQDWPEPYAIPGRVQPGMAQLHQMKTTGNDGGKSIEGESENQGQAENTRPKVKKLKRKSIPQVRKYDPGDPRIITLDSLGGAHSPTCSNLREYLVCEAKARHNVDIVMPSRLGMTAKGLPQQSNYCDCGVFVLSYVKKFLENPDGFVHSILQGDLDEHKDWAEMEAPKMRESIRELIFQLHAQQIHDEKERRGTKSTIKRAAYTRTQAKESSKLSTNEPEPASLSCARSIESDAEFQDSDPVEPFIKSTSKSVDSTFKDVIRPRTPDDRWSHSTTAENLERAPIQEAESRLIDSPRARRSRAFLESAIAKTKEAEIMETPYSNLEDKSILAPNRAVSQDGGHLSSPTYSTTSSIQPNSASPYASWLRSPARKTVEGSNIPNPFKEFAKPPYQNTRQKSRYNGTSEHHPLEITDSQEDRELEVQETPPMQVEQEDSFENIMELPSEPRTSKFFHPRAPDAPSPSRFLRRKPGAQR